MTELAIDGGKMSTYLSIHAQHDGMPYITAASAGYSGKGSPLILTVRDASKRRLAEVTIYTGNDMLTAKLVQAINTAAREAEWQDFLPEEELCNLTKSPS